MHPRSMRSPGALVLVCALSATLLTACSTPRLRHANEPSPHEFAARGYAPIEQTPTSSTSQNWVVSGQAIKLALSVPERGNSLPLVLYLPGLGESSDAGEKWRSAWAAAGYAVMSVQPLADDANAWSSDLAREGDFKNLGKQRYGAAAMADRLRLLDQVLGEAKRHASAGEPLWQRVAWDRVAIAGFDLGAYTAMAAAGEHVGGSALPLTNVRLRAVIALSPFASFSQGLLNTRYGDIHLPVFSVTSDVDRDALGMVNSPLLRSAAFLHMNGSDKYLLSVRGLPHAALSGSSNAARSRAEELDAKQAADERHAINASEAAQRSRSGKRMGAASWDGGEHLAAAVPLSANGVELGRIAIQSLSTAFIDAYVRDDSLARDWLAADAQRWLGKSGELLHR
ncbi:MAG TPA: hypothetical protein VHQ87_18495 [Rhizobacter sp.]|nr:hypothetical protein [Rhizobacter sp.]